MISFLSFLFFCFTVWTSLHKSVQQNAIKLTHRPSKFFVSGQRSRIRKLKDIVEKNQNLYKFSTYLDDKIDVVINNSTLSKFEELSQFNGVGLVIGIRGFRNSTKYIRVTALIDLSPISLENIINIDANKLGSFQIEKIDRLVKRLDMQIVGIAICTNTTISNENWTWSNQHVYISSGALSALETVYNITLSPSDFCIISSHYGNLTSSIVSRKPPSRPLRRLRTMTGTGTGTRGRSNEYHKPWENDKRRSANTSAQEIPDKSHERITCSLRLEAYTLHRDIKQILRGHAPHAPNHTGPGPGYTSHTSSATPHSGDIPLPLPILIQGRCHHALHSLLLVNPATLTLAEDETGGGTEYISAIDSVPSVRPIPVVQHHFPPLEGYLHARAYVTDADMLRLAKMVDSSYSSPPKWDGEGRGLVGESAEYDKQIERTVRLLKRYVRDRFEDCQQYILSVKKEYDNKRLVQDFDKQIKPRLTSSIIKYMQMTILDLQFLFFIENYMSSVFSDPVLSFLYKILNSNTKVEESSTDGSMLASGLDVNKILMFVESVLLLIKDK